MNPGHAFNTLTATARPLRFASDAEPGAGRLRAAGGASSIPTRCSSCNLREVCLPCGMAATATDPLFDERVYTLKRLKRGETLFRAGAAFDSLYAVRSGFLKSRTLLEDLGWDRSAPAWR